MTNLVEAELASPVTVRENGNTRRITKKVALIKNLVNSAIKGQASAIKALVPMIFDTESAHALAEQRKTLSRDDAEILDAALARLSKQRSQDTSAEEEGLENG
jgi:histone H3/H4